MAKTNTSRARMPALSIRQPFAELIIQGKKPFEYQSMATHKRGRVYIYASLTDVGEGRRDQWRKAGSAPGDLPRGVIIGSVEIVDCEELDEDGYRWRLANPKRLKRPRRPVRRPQPVFFYPW